MRGPNYWSNYRENLIVIKLDLEEFKDIESHQIPHFNENLIKLLPSLYSHRCSLKKEGGFIERLKTGTLLGHVLEHIALELQTLAGMDCGFGRARETKDPGIYNIVFSYQIEKAGVLTSEIALRITQALANQETYENLSEDIKDLQDIYANERLGPSTESIALEAKARSIPFSEINSSTYLLGHGVNQRIISATLTNKTSCIGVDIAADKDLTKQLLSSNFIPVPRGFIIDSLQELNKLINKLEFPIVMKPRYGNHGRGISTNINTKEKAISAFELALKVSPSVVMEKYIEGSDYRFLVIDYKVVAVAKRIAACITGDGVHTISELIDMTNKDPNRGDNHENILTKIKIDESTLAILTEKNLTLDSILPLNKVLFLKDTANISTGGTAHDVTEITHPHNIFLAERAARLINLDVCGIDVIAKDITKPISEKNNGAILEINAAPGFRMHLHPTSGKNRNVAKPFLDLLYKPHESARIPTIAVTGTNGKTTVVRLIAHVAALNNYTVGMTTTDGIYINNFEVYVGDSSGPASSKIVLQDPSVDFAVLECARGGILRSGLGFDKCSVSIVTNISEDHLGLNDIHSLEELAKVKVVVPHSTVEDGYAILNANDDLVYAMKNELHCHLAFFSTIKNERIQKELNNKNLVCFIDNNEIFIGIEGKLTQLMHVDTIPLTFSGRSLGMKEDLLPAILALWINKIPLNNIIKGLMSFYPNPENLPGRMNIFNFKHCKVMVDYAHNENAYISLKDFLSHINAKKKIGIIAGTGDRRPLDIWKTGNYAAQIFDEIIIRYDKDSRGRNNQEISNLILEGINAINKNITVKITSNEFETVAFLIEHAEPGTFIWYFPDNVLASIKFLKNLSYPYKVQSHESLI